MKKITFFKIRWTGSICLLMVEKCDFQKNNTFFLRFISSFIYIFHTIFKNKSWNIKENDLPRLKNCLNFAQDSKICLFWAKMAIKWSKNGQKLFLLVQVIAPSLRCISDWKNVTFFFKINAILWELWVFSRSGSNQLPIGWSVAYQTISRRLPKQIHGVRVN